MLKHRFALSLALSVLAPVCWSVTPLSAQQPAAPVPPQATQVPAPTGSSAEKKPDYGQWWMLHAREVNPRPPGWLFHAEGTGSFSNSTGSMSGYEFSLNVLSALRKGLVTNQAGAAFELDDQRLEDNGGSLKQHTIRFFDMVFFNVTRSLDLVTAVMWERNEPKQVRHRVAVFAGPSRSIAFSKGRVLGVAAALGYEEEYYYPPLNDHDEKAPIVYLQNTYRAPIATKGVFTHFFEVFFDLENEDDIRLNWNLGLNLQLTPNIGIGPSLQVRYDSRPVTEVQSTDTMLRIGVQFK